MSTEPTMKLYAISVAAMHEDGTATAIGVQSVIATLPEGASVDDTGLQVARSIFPEHDNDSAHLIALLDEWASDESGEQETTFATFANNIDAERRRLGMRTLFDAERDSA
jgi:hypothetical protein